MKKEDFDILNDILLKVSDWLKFAEAKNALLLTLTGAAVFAFLNYSKSICLTSNIIGKIYFYIFIIFSLASLATVLVSFLPQTKLFWLWDEKNLGREPNIFFFGDLAYIKPQTLIHKVYPEVAKANKDLYDLMLNIAEQIVTNSRIARRKYNLFRVSLWLFLSAIFTPIVSSILYIFLDPHWNESVGKN